MDLSSVLGFFWHFIDIISSTSELCFLLFFFCMRDYEAYSYKLIIKKKFCMLTHFQYRIKMVFFVVD